MLAPLDIVPTLFPRTGWP